MSLLKNTLSGLGALTRQLSSLSLGRSVTRQVLSGHRPLASTPNLPRCLSTAAVKPATCSSLLPNNPIHPASLGTGIRSLLQPLNPSLPSQPIRTRVVCARSNGKPRHVRAVTDRFFRLENGLWIRTRAGKNKKRWKKNLRRVAKLQEHVFCTQRQCWTLDRMTSRYFKLPKYYANDPYYHYHKLQNLPHYKYELPRFLP